MVSGNMKEYLNYLTKNPSKLLFALGGSVFAIFLIVICLLFREDIVMNNSLAFYLFIQVFSVLILFVVNYQVYIEWKDGRNR